LYVIITFS